MQNSDFINNDENHQWCLSENKEIEVYLDSELISSISNHNSDFTVEDNPLRISVNLFKLIMAIGTIKTLSSRPTSMMKFYSVCDLLEFIQNSPEFKIIYHPDSEAKRRISEELGIGLSILIANYFYDIQWSTLTKIALTGNASKPDIRCLTSQSKEMVIEAKGTINESTRITQKEHSLDQKVTVSGDIRVSSCSLLKNEAISNVEFVDPPIIPPNDRKYRELLLKTDHYSRIFNFIGQNELSVYFSLMKKRIMYDMEFPEYSEKDRLFNKLKRDYITISKINKQFVGNIEKDSFGNFIFIGIDENLISAQGFIDFKDYNTDSEITDDNNNSYYISSDGICFAKLTDITFLRNKLRGRTIPYYQESVSLIDLDSMNKISFTNYISYLFKRLNCTVLKELNLQDNDINMKYVPDLIVIHDDTKILVELKKSFRMNNFDVIDQLNNYANKCQCQKSILITTKRLKENQLNQADKSTVTIIDRNRLQLILENNSLLLEYLN